jgi:hypothetical protein
MMNMLWPFIPVFVVLALILFSRHIMLAGRLHEFDAYRMEWAKRQWVLVWADLGFMFLYVIGACFFSSLTAQNRDALIALAVLGLIASVGFFGLRGWDEWRFLKEKMPDRVAGITLFTLSVLLCKLVWGILSYYSMSMFIR